MKSTFVSILGLLMSLMSFADGTQNPVPTVPLLASVMSAGGFSPLRESGIQINSLGQVFYIEQRYGQPVGSTLIATLSQTVLVAFQSEIASATSGTLVDPDPNSHGCTDAPITTYSVTNAAGAAVTLEQDASCKQKLKSSMSDDESKALREIKALRDFGYAARGF